MIILGKPERQKLKQGYKSAKISVWWVIENWDDYKDADLRCIKENIRSALARKEYRGNVSIFLYVDQVNATKIPPQHVWADLFSSGISIKLYPKDEKLAMLTLDMMLWAEINPIPANYLFILDDERLCYPISYLIGRRYNILVALSPEARAPSLAAFAKDGGVWLLPSLLSGETPVSEVDLEKLCYDEYDPPLSEAELDKLLDSWLPRKML